MTVDAESTIDPTKSHDWRRFAPWGLVLAGLVLRQLLLHRSFHFFVDDAYIFLRYAREAAIGNGLVYNAGAHVMGFTSPLYVLILTALGAVFGVSHLVGATSVVDSCCYVAASGALIGLGRSRQACLPVLLAAWLLWFPLVAASVNGMESMLFIALMFGSLALATRDHYGWAFILAALAILTRPEGVIFAIVLVGAVLWRRSMTRRSLPGIGAAIAILLAWSAFALVTYGSVVPQSIRAKGAASSSSGPLQTLAVVSSGISSTQLQNLSSLEQDAAIGLGIICLAIVGAGLIVEVRRRAVAAVIPAWFLCTWLFYVVGRPIELWSWYSAPTTLALWWTVSRHGPTLLTMLRLRLRRRRPVPAMSSATLKASLGTQGLFLIGVTTVITVVSLILGVEKRSQSLDQSVVGLHSLGMYIKQVAPQARSLQIDDIGIIGWESNYRIIDGAGLVSPVASQRAHGHLLSSATIALRTRPDAVVLKADLTSDSVRYYHRLLRPLYDSEAQRKVLLSEYRVSPLYGLGGYRALLVRRTQSGP